MSDVAPPAGPLTSGPATSSQYAGTFYGDLIKEQLIQERSRKTSIEQRGIVVIQTAGILVSLLFGLGAVITKAQNYALPGAARALLVVSVTFFVAAAILGLATNWPVEYDEATPDALDRLVQKEYWEGQAHTAARRSAEVRVKILRTARSKNNLKATELNLAIATEVVGILFVAASVAVILST